MALMTCPECGQSNVSDAALACPKCGFPIREYVEHVRQNKVKSENNTVDKKIKYEYLSEKKEAPGSKAYEVNNKVTVQDDGNKENQNEQKRIKIVKTVIICCAALILAIWFINVLIMSGRKTFANEEEMKEQVCGVYTYYSENTNQIIRQMRIEEDNVKIRYDRDDFYMTLTIDKWNPKRGTISVGSDSFIVLSNGDIKDDIGKTNTRGGNWVDENGHEVPDYTSDYLDVDENETASEALEFEDVFISDSNGITTCYGKIKNYGTKSYSFIRVQGMFVNSVGEMQYLQTEYANGTDSLAPGESISFSLSVSYDERIKDCELSIVSSLESTK